MRHPFLALTMLLVFEAAYALDPKDFPRTTWKQFEVAHPADGPGNQYATPTLPLAVRAKAGAKFRPLPATVRSFLESYKSHLGHTLDGDPLPLYAEETLVTEEDGGRQVWVPIQKDLVTPMRQTPEGAPVLLLLRYFGRREGQPIYLMVSFGELKRKTEAPATAPQGAATGEAHATITQSTGIITFAAMCAKLGCNSADGQFFNPPYEFQLEGRFTGKTRPLPQDFSKFLTNYHEGFPGTFKADPAILARAFVQEAELEESGTKVSIWMPVQSGALDAVKSRALAVVHGGAYGSRAGTLQMLAVKVEVKDDPSSLLRRARGKKK